MLAQSHTLIPFLFAQFIINNLGRLSQANSLRSLESVTERIIYCRVNSPINTRSIWHPHWEESAIVLRKPFLRAGLSIPPFVIRSLSRLRTGLLAFFISSFLIHFSLSFSSFPVPTFRPTKCCHALTSIVLTLYIFLFVHHADDDSAERQRINIADTDASEWRWYTQVIYFTTFTLN